MGASGLCCDTSIPTEVGEPLNAFIRTFSFASNGLGMMRVSLRYVVPDHEPSEGRLPCPRTVHLTRRVFEP
jgi:hypothetical protein